MNLKTNLKFPPHYPIIARLLSNPADYFPVPLELYSALLILIFIIMMPAMKKSVFPILNFLY